MNVLVYNFFYWTLYIFGKSINKYIFKSKDFFGIPVSILYPIYSLLFIGNLSFILNFFLGGKYIRYICYFLIGSSLVYFLINKYNFDNQFTVITIFNSFIAISSYGTILHYDAGGYHLLNQNWILNEKTVFGLSNIIFPLGNQSLFEYISFNFWISNNFIYHHFLNLVFFTFFFAFLFNSYRKSNSKFLKFSSLVILAFGFFDNFGIEGGANGFPNIQNAGKPDIAVAILLIVINLIMINFIFENKPNSNNYKIIIFLGLFLIQLKPTSFHIILFILFIVWKYRSDFLSFSFVKFNLSIISISFLWLLKNVLTTSCLLFPVSFTCFKNLNWYSEKMVDAANNHYSSTYLPYKIGENVVDWFNVWKSINYNEQIFYNFTWSFILIFLVTRIFGKKVERRKEDIFFVRLYFLFSVLAFFVSVPLFRYFFGIFTPLVLLFTLNRELNTKLNKNKIINYLAIAFIFLSPLLIVRGYSFGKFIENPLTFTSLKVPSINYEKNDNWGYRPIKDEFSTKETFGVNEFGKCWININCNPENREIYINEIFVYKMITERK